MLLNRALIFIRKGQRVVEGGFNFERRHAKVSGRFPDIIFVTVRDPRNLPNRQR